MDPKKNWIVILEPSPFRRDETTVEGPFGKWRSAWVAWRYCCKHPFAATVRYRVNEHTKVTMGNKVLWPREETEE